MEERERVPAYQSGHLMGMPSPGACCGARQRLPCEVSRVMVGRCLPTGPLTARTRTQTTP